MRFLSNCGDSAKLRCKRAWPIVLLVAFLFCGGCPCGSPNSHTQADAQRRADADNSGQRYPSWTSTALLGAVAYSGPIGNFTLAAVRRINS